MDHDAMLRDVSGLKNFRTRAEKAIAFIEGLQTAGYKPPGDTGATLELSDAQKTQIREQFSEIIKPVSDAIDIKLNSFDDRLKSQEGAGGGVSATADFSQRLAALEKVKTETDEQYDRLEQMLTWFEANKEGLEVLLSLDGEVDQPEGSAGANAGAGTASGAVSGAAGAEGAGSTEGAHPGSFNELSQGAGGPSIAEQQNDPSARAEAAVAEPVAKP